MVNEEFLQFIWRKEVYFKKNLRTTCGKKVVVVQPGVQNFHAGPDFFNARIKIDQLDWAGNVEIHLNSSDWKKHGHHTDPGYNNVVLHVVQDVEGETINSLGRRIPTLKINYHESLISRYKFLMKEECWLACCHYFQCLTPSRLSRLLKQLHDERTTIKTNRIHAIFRYYNHGWEETLYLALASGFGLPVNCLPFELLASRIPLQLLLKNREDLLSVEALFFGQAGFLELENAPGSYPEELLERYNYLKSSVSGRAIPRYLWKFLRLRPASFPTLRISQFANLAHHRFPIMKKLMACTSRTEMEHLLSVRATDYWNTHYIFGKCSPESAKHMGSQSIRTLIINVVVPFLITYGKIERHTSAIKQAAKTLLELDAESNHIIRKWSTFGIRINNAFESQALIQLYNTYCKQNRCLDCPVGASFIESPQNEKQ